MGYCQLPVAEQLQLIETSEHLDDPYDLIGELQLLQAHDNLALITFSKASGELLDYCNTNKESVLIDLQTTGFQKRFFVVLVDKKAIFYLDN
ncbi:hypothetical protein [Flagellimonas flava]|nr:hypothetical protein [Allomuricauda flava]